VVRRRRGRVPPSARGGLSRLALGDLRVRLRGSITADLAAIRSHAFLAWSDRYGWEGLASVLQGRGYYFGVGATAGARLEVAFEGLELGARLRHGWHQSVEGLHRHESDVSVDVSQRDRSLEWTAWLGYTPPGAVFHTRIGAREIRRSSEMGHVDRDRWDGRATAEVRS